MSLSETSSPFDSLADEYDELYEEFLITREIRPLIRGSLTNFLKPGDRVLELNCGTGTDAIAFAERGMKVTATDQSQRMLEKASWKIQSRNLESQIILKRVDFNDFSAATFNGVQFDGVFSNFDGLNCAPNIGIVMQNISSCLKPGGVVVMCVLNKYCIWEIMTFLLRGKMKQAFRRFSSQGIEASLGGNARLPIWYFTLTQIRDIMTFKYDILDIYAVNVVSPTLNSTQFVNSHPVLTQKLLTLDSFIRRMPIFRGLGDHFVVVARRR